MRSECEYLNALKDAVRAQLPPGAFLKLDRGDALLITNAKSDLPIAGFTLEARGSLTAVCPGADIISAFEEKYEPAGELSRSILRFRGSPAVHEAVLLFSEGLKLAQMSAPSGRVSYDRRVRQFIARAMRTGQTGGTYAAALLCDMNDPFSEV